MPPGASPSDVRIDDRPYARPAGTPLLARIYRTGSPVVGAPAIVEVHPGAWTHGDRTWGRVYCEALAQRGFVVVSLDFRQAPSRHPAASADVATGVRWVRACSDDLGADPARISLVGSSSGGHLALLAACRPDAPEHAGAPLTWDGDREVAGEIDASVGRVAALWAPVDTGRRYDWIVEGLATGPADQHENLATLRAGMDGYFGDRETMERASVTRVVRDGEASRLPAVWFCHPELDENVPRFIPVELERTWRAAGGEISVTVYPGQPHAFGHRPGDATDRLIDELAAFLA